MYTKTANFCIQTQQHPLSFQRVVNVLRHMTDSGSNPVPDHKCGISSGDAR
jgi:hypothetical protein